MNVGIIFVYCLTLQSVADAASTHMKRSDSGCRLPQFPVNGHYTLASGQPFEAGDLVPYYTVLGYSCKNKNYVLSEDVSVCRKSNNWSNKPTCKKPCTMPTSFTVDFKCISSTNVEIPCAVKMDSGTKIEPTCKAEHLAVGYLDTLTCKNGEWDRAAPKCLPECGFGKSFGVTHIVNGQVAKKDSLPWHVGIYQDKNGNFEQICGGSILQTHIIISAAHCFYDERKKRIMNPKQYKVAARKYYRIWNHEEDIDVQRSDVSLIKAHEFYGGDEQNQQTDVALIIIETPFTFSDSVHPICLDLVRSDFNKYQLKDGNLGQVAGWGLTETGRVSEELKTLKLPVIDYKVCKIELSQYQFTRYMTQDKLCAGYLNGSALCRGDSGGGLVFPARDVVGMERWYLRGIVSNGPLNEDRTSCRTNTYSAFTNVFSLRSWIVRQLHIFETQLDGCVLPDFPDNGEYIIGNSTTLAVPGVLVPHFTQLGYFCEPGYHLSDEDQVLCQDTNVWSPRPKCISDASTCPALPENAVTIKTTGQKAWDKCIELAESVHPCTNGIREYACSHVATPLIVGGTAAVPGEFPHMAHLGYKEDDTIKWQCGGSLISERWVLSSGNCVVPRNTNLEVVRLGGGAIDVADPANIYKVATLVAHPDFKRLYIYNDIGLVQLDREVTFTKFVRPACLHVGNEIDDSKLTATGWGRTAYAVDTFDNFLNKVVLHKYSEANCSQEYNKSRRLFKGIDHSIQLCYGDPKGLKDTCQGDSGGPLQIYNGHNVDCTYLVVGISSFGKGCAGFVPGIYTKVSAYISWVESVVWPQVPAEGSIAAKIPQRENVSPKNPSIPVTTAETSIPTRIEGLPVWD